MKRYGMNIDNARSCAVAALLSGERKKSYSDVNLNTILSENRLDGREKALAANLYYGVLQNRIYIDHCLSKYSSVKLNRVHPLVLNILRVGAYQILFLDRIPDSAAVNEAVKIAKSSGESRAAGYINALLRKIAASGGGLEDINAHDMDEYLSVKYSHPREVVKLIRKSLPQTDIEALLRENNKIPPVSIRANALKTTPEELREELSSTGIDAKPDADIKECMHIEASGDITDTDAYKTGLFSIQDKASMLAVLALEPCAGDFIIDGCAAPGGKSMYAAELTGDGAKILSCDIYDWKLRQIEQNAQRLGISCVKTLLCDALSPKEEYFGTADRVIADVPCSGLGIIRKKPDIRYKDLNEIAALPKLQLDMLISLSKYVKPGGILLYSTCTILPRENEEVIRAFLNRAPDFALCGFFEERGGPYRAPGGYITLFPHIHETDGFFICKMRKIR